MKILIEIDNVAGLELARILRDLAGKVEDWRGASEFSVMALDRDGNPVGRMMAEKDL